MNHKNSNLYFWMTEIRAICPQTGELLTYGGPDIEALTQEDAQRWCNENLGYLKVVGRLTMTIPTKIDEDGNTSPDWDNAVDLDEGRWN